MKVDTAAALLFALTVLQAAAPARAVAQEVRGRTVSSVSGGAVPTAEVSLVNDEGIVVAHTQSNPTGSFVLRAPSAGAFYLHAEALGYLSYLDGPIDLARDAPVQVEMSLRPAPLPIDSLAVTVEARSPALETTGFYRRLKAGQGFLMDRTAVEARRTAQTVSDLLTGIPGVSLDNEGRVTLRGMGSLGLCKYRVYLDGLLVVDRQNWWPEWARSLIHPQNIEGIEVYRRPSEIPVQYGGAESGCGVILIWSKR